MRHLLFLSLGIALAALVACGGNDAPPALAVDDIQYGALEAGALPETVQHDLALVTALGLAVARGDSAALLGPFIRQDLQAELLRCLATEVSLRLSGIDDAELRAAYARQPAHELVVRHLIILSERWRSDVQRAEARARAAAALDRIRRGEDFALVAGEVSEEPGADRRGGLLQPGREGTWVKEFWAAAAALPVGGVSDVVETEYGFHVLKLEDRREVPFEEMRAEVAARVVDPARTAAAARAWADSTAAVVGIVPASVDAFRRGPVPDTLVLAHWPSTADGGATRRYTAVEFAEYLVTLAPETRDRLAATTSEGYAAVVAAAARNAFLAEQAVAMGVQLPREARERIERSWRERVARWAATFGFEQKMGREQVRSTALAAIGSERQGIRIAREEIRAIAPALERLYPIRRARPQETAADS